MDGGIRSTHMREEEEEAEADYLKEEEAVVGLVEEAAKEKSKEIDIKVKMSLT